MKLSEKLIALRKEKGWSQEDFAEKLYVSRQAISRWENGTALPDAQNLLGISKLFNVSADYLLNDEYEGARQDSEIEAIEPQTAPPAPKKKHLYWCWILAGCLFLSIVCIGILLVTNAGDRSKASVVHHALYTIVENEISSTCTAEGSYDEVVYCKDCGEEILRTTKSAAKLSHTLSSSMKMNEIASTCTTEGSYDEIVCCTVCKEELLRTHRSTEMGAHQFQNRKCIVCGQAQPSEGLLFVSGGDGTCSVGVGDCRDEDIVIPEYSPDGDKVTQINANAFAGRNQVKSIQIPETVTIIGEGAFQDCSNLETVNLPKGITNIYSYTFDGCKSLKEITIPTGVLYIGEKAFADCMGLKSIAIPASVGKIGMFAFENFSDGKGTITLGIYEGWEVYDSSDKFVAEVDFSSGTATEFEYFTNRFPEYVWKRS